MSLRCRVVNDDGYIASIGIGVEGEGIWGEGRGKGGEILVVGQYIIGVD